MKRQMRTSAREVGKLISEPMVTVNLTVSEDAIKVLAFELKAQVGS